MAGHLPLHPVEPGRIRRILARKQLVPFAHSSGIARGVPGMGRIECHGQAVHELAALPGAFGKEAVHRRGSAQPVFPDLRVDGTGNSPPPAKTLLETQGEPACGRRECADIAQRVIHSAVVKISRRIRGRQRGYRESIN